MKTKTEIMIRTLSRTTVRAKNRKNVRRCAECAVDSPLLSPNEAAEIRQLSAREIFRLAEAGAIHFIETETGALFVCRRSLERGFGQFDSGSGR